MTTKEKVPERLIHQLCTNRDEEVKIAILKEIKGYDISDCYGQFLDVLKNIQFYSIDNQEEIKNIIKEIFNEQDDDLFLDSPLVYVKDITISKIYLLKQLDYNEVREKYACNYLAQTLQDLVEGSIFCSDDSKYFNINIKTTNARQLEYVKDGVESLLNVIITDLNLPIYARPALSQDKIDEYKEIYELGRLNAKLEKEAVNSKEEKNRLKI